MNYEKYLTVTMSVGTLNNFTWDGNGNFTAAGNVTALLDSAAPMLFLPLKCQHSYHTYLTKRNSAQLPEE